MYNAGWMTECTNLWKIAKSNLYNGSWLDCGKHSFREKQTEKDCETTQNIFSRNRQSSLATAEEHIYFYLTFDFIYKEMCCCNKLLAFAKTTATLWDQERHEGEKIKFQLHTHLQSPWSVIWPLVSYKAKGTKEFLYDKMLYIFSEYSIWPRRFSCLYALRIKIRKEFKHAQVSFRDLLVITKPFQAIFKDNINVLICVRMRAQSIILESNRQYWTVDSPWYEIGTPVPKLAVEALIYVWQNRLLDLGMERAVTRLGKWLDSSRLEGFESGNFAWLEN